MIEPLLKPKQQKRRKRETIKRDGREVLSKHGWDKRREELHSLCSRCFRCGAWMLLDENFHAHHSRGTRGLGGGMRDDRIFVPGETDQDTRAKYLYMPGLAPGIRWNLYSLCGGCHREGHGQGCSGELQWSDKRWLRENH